jgi:hypothetical protein
MENIRRSRFCKFGIVLAVVGSLQSTLTAESRVVSGVYPHLAMFNDEAECGTGAVVPWAGRLWVVTYAPHKPEGSADKLYEITPDLQQIIRHESIGGTPANRMIHRESQQLFIGPYAIDGRGNVRVIPYTEMFGRPTGNARHLFDPAEKIYYATMEEGFYEVDVKTLKVTGLWTDEHQKEGRKMHLPGYHGKGLYSGQGRIVYANNGEQGAEARINPTVSSGALAEWNGRAEQWTLVRRNQFTEVSGPGGIYGNKNPEHDPIWTVGWDHRSLILQVLDKGKWYSYRLPKASHSYDGAHGWNTEWPRIRDIGEKSLLMTMHGTFWKFPKTFSAGNSAGIEPLSNYLKVIGDFCRWKDSIVFGCDDAARSEFLNKRRAKGEIAGPGRSQSNLWFVDPDQLDDLGPAIGRGSVWLNETVRAGVPSDPFLFSGYTHRGLHLAHNGNEAITFKMEVDVKGSGEWRSLREVIVPARGYVWVSFSGREKGAWIRLRANRDATGVTVAFSYGRGDRRSENSDSIFKGLAEAGDLQINGGLLHARGDEAHTLRVLVEDDGSKVCYDLDGKLILRPANDRGGAAWMQTNVAIPQNVLSIDDASVLYVDDNRQRWRLPRGSAEIHYEARLGRDRISREVCTERDLFNAGGTFYELPAENAGGFAKIRPISTHNRAITDYASYRGLLVLSGINDDASSNKHIVRSADGRCALWIGVVDDLWRFGKARGVGGPWKKTTVEADEPSDPYLMTGFDKKRVRLSHTSVEAVTFKLETDVAGAGNWVVYREFSVPPHTQLEHVFPEAYDAYWVRLTVAKPTTATAWFEYQ